MVAHTARLAQIFTPYYACRINAQIVHPNIFCLVKPNELESALARPIHLSMYEPKKTSRILGSHAGTRFSPMFHSMITDESYLGHPFMDGNKRTAFFLANEYLRAMGIPGLADNGKLGAVYGSIIELAERYMDTAAGRLDVKGLAEAIQDSGHNQN
ncbi:hypothetical protein C8Q75DRAFT_795213 [Abortiporus biennis]|nr:hypothetical protein C8Q75DRAFT_795213 [Abortiporus biennis]